MAEYRFKKLIVWQRAMELATEVNQLTKGMKGRGSAALADQMRRAAMSVPANIAEGNGRSHRAEYLRFLSIANGSLAELETQLDLVSRLHFLTPDALAPTLGLVGQTGRLLTGLIQALRQSAAPAP